MLSPRGKKELKINQRRILINSIEIGIPAPEQVFILGQRHTSNGKVVGRVRNSKTLNYKSFTPHRDGLFCERIFGPVQSYICACGKQGPLTTSKGTLKFCPRCEVEYTDQRARRYRVGYIGLVSPVTHIWHLKGRPSYLSLFLGKRKKTLATLAYCNDYLVEQAFSKVDVNRKFSLSTQHRPIGTDFFKNRILKGLTESKVIKGLTLSREQERSKIWSPETNSLAKFDEKNLAFATRKFSALLRSKSEGGLDRAGFLKSLRLPKGSTTPLPLSSVQAKFKASQKRSTLSYTRSQTLPFLPSFICEFHLRDGLLSFFDTFPPTEDIPIPVYCQIPRRYPLRDVHKFMADQAFSKVQVEQSSTKGFTERNKPEVCSGAIAKNTLRTDQKSKTNCEQNREQTEGLLRVGGRFCYDRRPGQVSKNSQIFGYKVFDFARTSFDKLVARQNLGTPLANHTGPLLLNHSRAGGRSNLPLVGQSLDGTITLADRAVNKPSVCSDQLKLSPCSDEGSLCGAKWAPAMSKSYAQPEGRVHKRSNKLILPNQPEQTRHRRGFGLLTAARQGLTKPKVLFARGSKLLQVGRITNKRSAFVTALAPSSLLRSKIAGNRNSVPATTFDKINNLLTPASSTSTMRVIGGSGQLCLPKREVGLIKGKDVFHISIGPVNEKRLSLREMLLSLLLNRIVTTLIGLTPNLATYLNRLEPSISKPKVLVGIEPTVVMTRRVGSQVSATVETGTFDILAPTGQTDNKPSVCYRAQNLRFCEALGKTGTTDRESASAARSAGSTLQKLAKGEVKNLRFARVVSGAPNKTEGFVLANHVWTPKLRHRWPQVQTEGLFPRHLQPVGLYRPLTGTKFRLPPFLGARKGLKDISNYKKVKRLNDLLRVKRFPLAKAIWLLRNQIVADREQAKVASEASSARAVDNSIVLFERTLDKNASAPSLSSTKPERDTLAILLNRRGQVLTQSKSSYSKRKIVSEDLRFKHTKVFSLPVIGESPARLTIRVVFADNWSDLGSLSKAWLANPYRASSGYRLTSGAVTVDQSTEAYHRRNRVREDRNPRREYISNQDHFEDSFSPLGSPKANQSVVLGPKRPQNTLGLGGTITLAPLKLSPRSAERSVCVAKWALARSKSYARPEGIKVVVEPPLRSWVGQLQRSSSLRSNLSIADAVRFGESIEDWLEYWFDRWVQNCYAIKPTTDLPFVEARLNQSQSLLLFGAKSGPVGPWSACSASLSTHQRKPNSSTHPEMLTNPYALKGFSLSLRKEQPATNRKFVRTASFTNPRFVQAGSSYPSQIGKQVFSKQSNPVLPSVGQLFCSLKGPLFLLALRSNVLGLTDRPGRNVLSVSRLATSYTTPFFSHSQIASIKIQLLWSRRLLSEAEQAPTLGPKGAQQELCSGQFAMQNEHSKALRAQTLLRKVPKLYDNQIRSVGPKHNISSYLFKHNQRVKWVKLEVFSSERYQNRGINRLDSSAKPVGSETGLWPVRSSVLLDAYSVDRRRGPFRSISRSESATTYQLPARTNRRFVFDRNRREQTEGLLTARYEQTENKPKVCYASAADLLPVAPKGGQKGLKSVLNLDSQVWFPEIVTIFKSSEKPRWRTAKQPDAGTTLRLPSKGGSRAKLWLSASAHFAPQSERSSEHGLNLSRLEQTEGLLTTRSAKVIVLPRPKKQNRNDKNLIFADGRNEKNYITDATTFSESAAPTSKAIEENISVGGTLPELRTNRRFVTGWPHVQTEGLFLTGTEFRLPAHTNRRFVLDRNGVPVALEKGQRSKGFGNDSYSTESSKAQPRLIEQNATASEAGTGGTDSYLKAQLDLQAIQEVLSYTGGGALRELLRCFDTQAFSVILLNEIKLLREYHKGYFLYEYDQVSRKTMLGVTGNKSYDFVRPSEVGWAEEPKTPLERPLVSEPDQLENAEGFVRGHKLTKSASTLRSASTKAARDRDGGRCSGVKRETEQALALLRNRNGFVKPTRCSPTASKSKIKQGEKQNQTEYETNYEELPEEINRFSRAIHRNARRLKIAQLLMRNKRRPEWMLISALPVLPPDLRPILQMSENLIVASDLNTLYQRVIYRNNRQHKLRIVEWSYATSLQRLVQDAVDRLIENGKGGSKPFLTPGGRPLKSLSDTLKGKKGRFRLNLLGKRVDFSGRSVIVVSPHLKIHECGLPREMALELYQYLLIRQMLLKRQVSSVILAKRVIRQQKAFVWDTLRELIYHHPILLNRAPTLHRLGIQAFQPKLVLGSTILLHPLVCAGFNADFDGDQMGVHLPLCDEARAEAWDLLWSRNNLLSPATGEPILLPSQDMVLGFYHMTALLPSRFAISTAQTVGFARPIVRSADKTDRRFNKPTVCLGYGFVQSDARPNSNKTVAFVREARVAQARTPVLFDKGLRKSHFFSPLDVVRAYQNGDLDIHTPIWLQWNGKIENNDSDQTPLEVRITSFGVSTQLYPSYKSRKDASSKSTATFNLFIRTTPGRVIVNNIFLASTGPI